MMRNRVLSLTRNVIPYVKELRELTDSVVGCILMQQLDYWFERYPNGFYKFLEASDHPKYSSGQSWSEEIGISATEFRTAFDKIGVRWKSKTEFEEAPDKFQGKFYASYQDKRANLTFYFRNHELVDQALDTLLQKINTSKNGAGGKDLPGSDSFKMPPIASPVTSTSRGQSTGDEDSLSPVDKSLSSPATKNGAVTGTDDSAVTVDHLSTVPEVTHDQLQEIVPPSLDITEITSPEITANKLLPPGPSSQEASMSAGSSEAGIEIPKTIPAKERDALLALVSSLPIPQAQQLIDELVGLHRAGAIRVSLISAATGMLKKMQAGEFTLAAGIAIQQERITRHNIQKAVEISNMTAASAVLTSSLEISPNKAAGGKRMGLEERLAEAGIVLKGRLSQQQDSARRR